MKLTKQLREAFVRAVMADVPEVNYNEQIEKMFLDAAVKSLPDKLRAVYQDESLRDYLVVTYTYAFGRAFCCPGPTTHLKDSGLPLFNPEQWVTLLKLVEAGKVQKANRQQLQQKLQAAVSSATTDKSLRDLLPEFAKYLPEPPVKVQYPVAVAGVVSEFTKAGWPVERSKPGGKA